MITLTQNQESEAKQQVQLLSQAKVKNLVPVHGFGFIAQVRHFYMVVDCRNEKVKAIDEAFEHYKTALLFMAMLMYSIEDACILTQLEQILRQEAKRP